MTSLYLDFVRVVVEGDFGQVARRLAASPVLATSSSDVGATRQESCTFFFVDIAHYLCAGDTALHMAAAVFRRQVAALLVAHGADCRAKNRRGAEPLHRAVRTRSLAAVRALVDGGADSRRPNKAGSTPLHLAVRTTGRGGSGLPQAREQQAGIVRLLLERGARATDQDKPGTSVHQAATGKWIRDLLREASAG